MPEETGSVRVCIRFVLIGAIFCVFVKGPSFSNALICYKEIIPVVYFDKILLIAFPIYWFLFVLS